MSVCFHATPFPHRPGSGESRAYAQGHHVPPQVDGERHHGGLLPSGGTPAQFSSCPLTMFMAKAAELDPHQSHKPSQVQMITLPRLFDGIKFPEEPKNRQTVGIINQSGAGWNPYMGTVGGAGQNPNRRQPSIFPYTGDRSTGSVMACTVRWPQI